MNRRRGAALAALAMVSMVAPSQLVMSAGSPAQAAGRPNIVLITTDDMNAYDLAWMPKTQELLQTGGVEVTDFISNHPLCCPARAQILTGQQAHNNGVYSNEGRRGGYDSLKDKGNHVGAWLKASGYKTAFVGKHLNYWPESGHFQPGWTVFDPMFRGGFKPYGITTFNNGRPKRYDGVYNADLVGNLTNKYIKRFSSSDAPFFIWASQLPPHKMSIAGDWVAPVPARRHRDLYPTARPPSLSSPSFREEDVSDKPRFIRNRRGPSARRMTLLHRARIRSLRSVDDQVGRIVQTLRRQGKLDNTYIFFTSDNGYLLGEHRYEGKNLPYEEALQVPLLVRGPGLPRDVRRQQMYGMADLASTFVDIANASPKRLLDSRSMLDTLRTDAPGYQRYLIQAAHRDPWWWRGVRSLDHTYVRWASGERELYDRGVDPFQLQSRADDPAFDAVEDDLAQQFDALKDCAGASCHGFSGAAP